MLRSAADMRGEQDRNRSRLTDDWQ